MLQLNDEQFDALITECMDELPKAYVEKLDNVAITFDDEPTPAQREKLRLRCHQTLYGLYEGVPRTERGAGYNMMLPDKITIFKKPIEHSARNPAELKEQVKNTLWHEIGHHYGLNHDRIHKLEEKMRNIRTKNANKADS